MSDSDGLFGAPDGAAVLPFRPRAAARRVPDRGWRGETWKGLLSSDSDGAALVRVHGEIDLANADEFSLFGRRVLAECTAVELDLTGVTFIDATGLQAVLRLIQEATSQGTSLHVSKVSPRVHRLLELTGLVSVLGIHGQTSAR